MRLDLQLRDADSELPQISLLWMLKYYVKLYLSNFPLAYERMVCKAPADFKPTFPGTYPTDVPIAVALTTDENDPWTETSHKFRFYEQPPIVKCDPCEVDVGSIREVYVWAEENSQFFEPLPSVQRKGIDLDA
jgi:hypothetical protein